MFGILTLNGVATVISHSHYGVIHETNRTHDLAYRLCSRNDCGCHLRHASRRMRHDDGHCDVNHGSDASQRDELNHRSDDQFNDAGPARFLLRDSAS